VLGPAPRAELLHVLMLPDFQRADRIGEFWGSPETRAFAELLIDLEEDRAARAVVFGLSGRWSGSSANDLRRYRQGALPHPTPRTRPNGIRE
jgi:hypothetical protein